MRRKDQRVSEVAHVYSRLTLMRWPSTETALTLVGGAVLVGSELLLADPLGDDEPLALDEFLALFVAVFIPVIVLVLVRVRPVLHWILFAVIVAATGLMLVSIARSESSTAGFGIVTVPLLLITAVLLAAVVDRFLTALGR